MTVAEIQDYIDEHYDDDENFHTMQELRTLYGKTLEEVKSMLDELEPNTISQAIKVIDKERDKLKFDVDKHQVDSCIFEIRNILRTGAKENKK